MVAYGTSEWSVARRRSACVRTIGIALLCAGCVTRGEAVPTSPHPVAVDVTEPPMEWLTVTQRLPPRPRAPTIFPARDRGTEPWNEVTPHRPAPAYVRLFETRRLFHYTVESDVDTHGADGQRAPTRWTRVVCEPVEVRSYYGALGSRVECAESVSAPDAVPFTQTFAFVSAPGGLWMRPSLPLDQGDLGDVIVEPPLLGEVPRSTRRTVARQAPADGEAEACSQQVTVRDGGTCFDERCSARTSYGETHLRFCLSGRGLESFSTENLDGPRAVRWRLQRVEELPDEPGCSG